MSTESKVDDDCQRNEEDIKNVRRRNKPSLSLAAFLMTSMSSRSLKRIGMTPSSARRLALSSPLTRTEMCKFFTAGLQDLRRALRTEPPLKNDALGYQEDARREDGNTCIQWHR
jgi:hypothetical protein